MKLQDNHTDARPGTPRDFTADNKENQSEIVDEEDHLHFEIDSQDSFHKMMKEQKDKAHEKDMEQVAEEEVVIQRLFRKDNKDKYQ